MKRFAILGATILFLGGCALPVPLQIASWALDGISYLMTEKSVADHGLSLVAQKDCAVLRGLLSEGEFCRDYDDQTTLVADKDDKGDKESGTEVASLGDIESLADFETAAGDSNSGEVAVAEMAWPLNGEDSNGLPGYPLEINVKAEPAPEVSPAYGPPDAFTSSARLAIEEWQAYSAAMIEVAAVAPSVSVRKSEPVAGLYFVIGSFRKHENARNLRRQFRLLTPSVLSAKLKRGTVYRVVVGPFGQQDAQKVHRTIFQAGISDSWAIRVKPGQWSMALVDPPALKAGTVPLVAGLSRQKREKTVLEFIQQLAALVY